MNVNFNIISFTEIEYQGTALDLHNDFDFVAADTEITEKQIRLHFKKSKGSWAINAKYEHLYFTIDNYNFLKQIAPEAGYIADDSCLSGITFFDPDFRDEDYALMERAIPNDGDDIIFSFESERVIRANGERVTLQAV
jgi:hypothetical protein